MDSVQKRSALKFTSMKSVSSFFLLCSILRGEDNFKESIVIVRCQVTAVRETRGVEEQMERIDQRRLRLTNHWFDTNEQLKEIQIVGKISHSRSHSLGEQPDRPSVRHQNAFDWPRTSRERSLFSEWINAGSWAGKTSDRQSTVVQMLLPVNDIGIKAFLFFKLIILMELHSNRFECLGRKKTIEIFTGNAQWPPWRQSDGQGQGPIDFLVTAATLTDLNSPSLLDTREINASSASASSSIRQVFVTNRSSMCSAVKTITGHWRVEWEWWVCSQECARLKSNPSGSWSAFCIRSHLPCSSKKKYRTLSKTRLRRESRLLPPTDNEIRTIGIEWSVSNACAALNWLCLTHRTPHIRRRVFGHFRSLA